MPTIFKIFGLLLSLTTYQNSLFAQEYLAADYAFFQKKAKLYQRWLDAKGMGEVLNVDKIELKKNGTELELFLSLQTTDPDTAAALWTGLVGKIESTNRNQTLSNVLYMTFIRLMEIPATQGNVQIYFPRKDGGGYNPCFYVWLWEENGKVIEESKVNNCRSQDIDIPVMLPSIQVISNKESLSIYQITDAQIAFEKVIKCARQKYEHEKENCEERNPSVEIVEQTDYALTFTVTDLCREVLTDEQKSLWCDFVEFWWGDCNDMRRERLEFSFKYIPSSTGYILSGDLTGKFGSGVYRPRISGYMDMEPDFEEDFLIPYVRRFQQDLKTCLERD